MNLRIATVILLICGATFPALAQMPRTISYQGVLADASGNLVSDGNYNITVKLYETLTGDAVVYTEAHTGVTVVRGVFNLIIGSVTPIPASLSFNRAYFLGVSVSGTELVPRTALTAAPYALYAATAGEATSLAPGATGVVTDVNGASGSVRLRGSGSTTVNRSGDTITISSVGGGGGTGIQGVQSPDNTLTVADGNGPIASLDIANGAVTNAKLANNAVTTSKIADGSITSVKLADGAVTSAKLGDGSVSTVKIQDSAVTTAKIRNAAITQEKIAPGVGFPPTGAASGDLTGSYPNPAIANDAVTTAKIADGTIAGADINNAATLNIATLNTTGNVGVGIATPGSRLTVKGSGNTLLTSSLNVMNSASSSILFVADNGSVGVNTANPVAALEVVGGAGTGLRLVSGSLQVPLLQVQAANNVAIPAGAVMVRITDDNANVPIIINMPVGLPGQIMIISNDDAVNIAGVAVAATPINAGQTRMFVFTGGGWRVVN